MRLLTTAAILAMVSVVSQAAAQKHTASDSLQHKQVNEKAKLGFLAGSYTTETTIPPGPAAPKGATGKGTSVITWALDSMFLVIDEQSMNSLFGQYKGHGLLGYDAQAHQFVLSMFNNFGDHPIYKGNLAGDTLLLDTRVPLPGRPFDQRLVWYKDGNAIRLKILNDMGKGYTLAIDQTSTPDHSGTK